MDFASFLIYRLPRVVGPNKQSTHLKQPPGKFFFVLKKRNFLKVVVCRSYINTILNLAVKLVIPFSKLLLYSINKPFEKLGGLLPNSKVLV